MPNIPPKANRRWKNCFSPFLYRSRNAIERMFCRLKDFRRVATRYDRNAANFLAAVCIAATVSYWLRVFERPRNKAESPLRPPHATVELNREVFQGSLGVQGWLDHKYRYP